MEKNTIELSLLEQDEKEELEYIWNLIPLEDRQGITEDDVLFVLDTVDDYLESIGLLVCDEETGEGDYLEGEIDESEQLEFVVNAAQEEHRSISAVQIQLILDGEMQYGVEQGYYEEE